MAKHRCFYPMSLHLLVSRCKDPVLVAITSASRCGVFLPYGPAEDWDGQSPYFCLDCYTDPNTKWAQVFSDDDTDELFTMIYRFTGDEAKTLRGRFNNAAVSGEPVEWTIEQGGVAVATIVGTWWWTTDSLLNGRTYPEDEAGGQFSLENSCWGAGTPNVSGGFDLFDFYTERDIRFGQCELEAGCCDAESMLPQGSNCGEVWIDGMKTSSPSLKSKLYVIE